MMFASILLMGSLCASETLDNALPVRVVGPWRIEVGPGTVTVDGRTISLPEAVAFDIPPSEIVQVRDEEHGAVPVFNLQTGGWARGAKLSRLITEECTATGLLVPESVCVKPASGEAAPFLLDKDYALDPFWATFGRVEGGAIAGNQPVFVDYDYSPCRLHSVVIDNAGKARLVLGEPGMGSQYPPEPGAGGVAVVNVWVPGRTEQLTDESLFPIQFQSWPIHPPQAEQLLPKTLAKLRAGEPVTIVAWGDSVTNGGGVGNRTDEWYQNQFHKLLQARFPKSAITLKTAAWGGGNSNGYMTAPAGGEHDFVRDVLDPKPDLITIEFVNDAYLQGEAMEQHYNLIMERLLGIGAEVALITPHLVRPDWMGVNTLKFDNDPRPYVADLRTFAAKNHVALADASLEWTCLWRNGIPYVTLEANSINHPDVRGHEIFARCLMGLFPAE